ncbi:hypothetical protein FRC01_004994 [Tulasnella sp. 417]|nr:hypothetical protein FRC01_004994 [Tulasnella sp. 417]
MDPTTLSWLHSPAKSTWSASTSNIYTLPIELLCPIFLYLYKDPAKHATNGLRNTHKLTFIMLVCKHWKDIVECTPTLWTDIWLGRGPVLTDARDGWITRLEALFERSGTIPLNLTITLGFVDLEDARKVLLHHLPRCQTLVLQPSEVHTDWALSTKRLHQRVSTVHDILSSPFPILQKILIDPIYLKVETNYGGPLQLDAPNLRFLSSYSPHIIPFVKAYGSPPAHDCLESFSIVGGWGNVMEMLPLTRVALPGLRSLSLTQTEDLWNILQVLETPNLECLVVDCGLADWPEEVNTPTPVLNKLRKLSWYTDPDATDEGANIHHLLQHCPNIESFSYLSNEDADVLLLALPDPLTETRDGSPRLCPKLRRLHLAYASFEQVRELVLIRPALEYVSLQRRKPEDTVTRSQAVWHEKVDLVRWIRSKVEFEFDRDRKYVGVPSDLEEAEGASGILDSEGSSKSLV